MDPRWLEEARKYIGQKEIPGKDSNPWIASMWMKLKGAQVWSWLGSDDSAAPWCGTFVAHCITVAGIPIPPHWYRAKAWLEWGDKTDFPMVGSVVVFGRKGGGHVGFVLGQDFVGNLMVLGGNQGDAVSIRPFDMTRVLGYRWPKHEVMRIGPLPILGSDGKVSTNEA